MKTTRRWYCEEKLQSDATLMLPADLVQHFITVLRLKEGDLIHPFNAHDGEWQALLQPAGKREWQIQVQTQVRPALPASHQVTLAFGLLKREAMDWLVEKASELGVTHLQPLITDHTPAERVNIERLQKIAREAAEQCERLDIPKLLPVLKLRNWLAASDNTALLTALERAQAQPLLSAIQKLALSQPLAILIGPAGGFSAHEAALLPSLPHVHCCDLGTRLLRAETAAIMCLSVLNACRQTSV